MVVLNQEQKLVLIAEIEDDRWVNEPDKRRSADTWMRQRYDQILPNCPIPRPCVLSLLDRALPPDFLAGQWDSDILSLNGFKKMQGIVAYIKAEVANVVGQ
ncbi:hypothetical protein AX17_003238 [Amanita inopinata Kibby_2008]|nr:hypothetical protein AX17_003238 [Amanita inopinata Kibby_2008]